VTSNPTDPQCPASDYSGPNRTLWFSFTPGGTRSFSAHFKSTHPAELYVGRQTRAGEFRLIDCNYENVRSDDGLAAGVVLDAEAGRTYLFMLRAYDADDGWGEFHGLFLLYRGGQPAAVSLTIDPDGSLDDETGTAHISGHVSCDNVDAFDYAVVEGDASQGEDSYGEIYDDWEWLCDQTERDWFIEVECEDCRLMEGPIDVTIYGRYGTTLGEYYFEAQESVRLWSGVGP